MVLPSKELISIIDETYEAYFSAVAKSKATQSESPNTSNSSHSSDSSNDSNDSDVSDLPKQSKSANLSNLLLRLSDFATIIEGNRAMKAGDIGRLMNMWKRWSVIANGVPNLRQYAVQLPRMIVPPGLSKVILHSLLIAPSGRHNHFSPKDYFLKHQNCWLKYIFNQTGRGTEISRLKDVYSVNVPMVRSD